jgi:hypothetical protein
MASRIFEPVNFVAVCALALFAMDLVGAAHSAAQLRNSHSQARTTGSLPVAAISRIDRPGDSRSAALATSRSLVIVIHSEKRPGDYVVVYAPVPAGKSAEPSAPTSAFAELEVPFASKPRPVYAF